MHIGNDEFKDLDIYNTDSMYKEAEEFCITHSLSEEKRNLLIRLLKEEVQNTLTRIDEEEEEHD